MLCLWDSAAAGVDKPSEGARSSAADRVWSARPLRGWCVLLSFVIVFLSSLEGRKTWAEWTERTGSSAGVVSVPRRALLKSLLSWSLLDHDLNIIGLTQVSSGYRRRPRGRVRTPRLKPAVIRASLKSLNCQSGASSRPLFPSCQETLSRFQHQNTKMNKTCSEYKSFFNCFNPKHLCVFRV